VPVVLSTGSAAGILGARHVVPLHFEHWAHFTQSRDTLAKAVAGLGERAHLLEPGGQVAIG
jgi:hypothetical protein